MFHCCLFVSHFASVAGCMIIGTLLRTKDIDRIWSFVCLHTPSRRNLHGFQVFLCSCFSMTSITLTETQKQLKTEPQPTMTRSTQTGNSEPRGENWAVSFGDNEEQAPTPSLFTRELKVLTALIHALRFEQIGPPGKFRLDQKRVLTCCLRQGEERTTKNPMAQKKSRPCQS